MRSWLIACAFAAVSVTAAAAASGPAPAVMTALLQLYGRYDPAGRCWQATAHGDESMVQACLAVVHSDEVAAPEGRRTYMVLEGRGVQDCHGCGGAIAFIVLGGADGLRVLAHSPAVPDGADGTPTDPQRIVLQQLGAAQWGWIEQTSVVGQGVTQSSFLVWLPRAERVLAAGRLPAGRDDKDTGECDRGDRGGCYDLTVSYRIDARNPQAPYYPILLQASGRQGRRRVTGQAVARFDLAKYAYQLSPGLP